MGRRRERRGVSTVDEKMGRRRERRERRGVSRWKDREEKREKRNK